MDRIITFKLDSTRNVRIDASHLSHAERLQAEYAMRDAQLIVDAFVWVAKKIEQFGARLFLKPSLKH